MDTLWVTLLLCQQTPGSDAQNTSKLSARYSGSRVSRRKSRLSLLASDRTSVGSLFEEFNVAEVDCLKLGDVEQDAHA